MPVRKSPETLRRACLDNMVNNFDRIWCPDGKTWRNIDDIRNFPLVTGPITNIPPDVLDDLIESLKDRMLLRRHHLHVLIRNSLERVNMASGIGDIYFALEFIQERCRNLLHLNLAYQKQISPDALMQLIKSIPLLRTLDLQHTQCVDQVMAMIGCHCPELLSLNVCSCPVSDYGIMGLCVNLKDNSAQCQKLVRLLVADTNVTTEGAAFAICYLPNLKEFDFDDMFTVLDAMHRGTSVVTTASRVKRYKISQLLSRNDEVTAERLHMAITLCPSVIRVSLQDVSLTDETLQDLAALDHLQELLLDNGIRSQMTFAKGISPLLKMLGQKLTKLHLSNVSKVDVAMIGRHCPRLQDLSLVHNRNYVPVNSYSELLVFSQLQRLEIVCTDHSDMSATILSRLLTNCQNLSTLDLKRCNCLNDNFVKCIIKINPLKNMRELKLQECNEITFEAILELLAQESRLDSIKLWSCSNISESDYLHLIEKVKAENLDISLGFAFFT